MSKIVILTGSTRPNNASEKIAKIVAEHIISNGIGEAEIVKVAELGLPFYNAPTSPSDESYVATDPAVIAWGQKVASADAVVLIMPEYNHAISAVQKNAIDWLYKEWNAKPVILVGYGWYEGKNVLDNARLVMSIPKATVVAEVGLGFMKQINPDGTPADSVAVTERLSAAFDALKI